MPSPQICIQFWEMVLKILAKSHTLERGPWIRKRHDSRNADVAHTNGPRPASIKTPFLENTRYAISTFLIYDSWWYEVPDYIVAWRKSVGPLCHIRSWLFDSTVPLLQYHHLADHFSKIRDMPSPHFWYMFLNGMKYLNEFWSGAKAWALYVIFGANCLTVQYQKLQY
jgi:hypothetical protein